MSTTTLQSVRRALTVLEEIARSSPITAKEVASACDLELATTYHLVNTLIEAGYVEKNDRKLFPTSRLVELGGAVERRLRPDPDLIAAMDLLAFETSETTCLSEWLRGDVVDVGSIEGAHPVRVGIVSIAKRGFAHARGSGKILLAFGPPERLDTVIGLPALRPRNGNTITDVSVLQNQIDAARTNGYAIDVGEYIDDVCCISAPIVEDSGVARYCLSVLVPASRYESGRDRLIESVVRAARSVRAHEGAL